MQLPKTTPEQRASMYEDIRQLLSPGFLAHGTTVNGVRIIQRSLSSNEWTLLQYRIDPHSSNSWKRWTVAASIWMVDGQITLGDEGALHRVYEMCSSLPKNILEDLYSILNALMRKVRKATELTEAYLYESESRYSWKAEGESYVTSGRMGTTQMGLNPVQKLWLFFNRTEDESLEERREWDMAKFIVGPHAPKGIKKVNAKDKQQRADHKRKREGIMDRTYYEVQGVLEKKKLPKGARFQKYEGWEVQVAETEEELQDEMRRWVAGIKDPHDGVIDYVKAKIKTEREGIKKKAKIRQEALAKIMEEEGIPKTQLVPMTGKAAQDFIERVKSRMPGTSKVMPDNTHNSAYEKYIKNNPEVGTLRVDDAGNVVSETPVDPNKMVEMLRKPDKGSQQDLQTLINGRRPTFDSLQDDEPEGGS